LLAHCSVFFFPAEEAALMKQCERRALTRFPAKKSQRRSRICQRYEVIVLQTLTPHLKQGLGSFFGGSKMRKRSKDQARSVIREIRCFDDVCSNFHVLLQILRDGANLAPSRISLKLDGAALATFVLICEDLQNNCQDDATSATTVNSPNLFFFSRNFLFFLFLYFSCPLCQHNILFAFSVPFSCSIYASSDIIFTTLVLCK
jgi:hypothetical protein